VAPWRRKFSRLNVLFICYGTTVEHRSLLNRSGIWYGWIFRCEFYVLDNFLLEITTPLIVYIWRRRGGTCKFGFEFHWDVKQYESVDRTTFSTWSVRGNSSFKGCIYVIKPDFRCTKIIRYYNIVPLNKMCCMCYEVFIEITRNIRLNP
jgi:hypothetical protein